MNTTDILCTHDIKPSLIRIMIYDFLRGSKDHPSADEIYQHISKSIPTLSKTTVYNTVNLLADKGLLKQLPIEGSQIRYDADTCYHGHFLCDKCGKVYDFGLKASFESGLDGFHIEQREVFYSGSCVKCNQ